MLTFVMLWRGRGCYVLRVLDEHVDVVDLEAAELPVRALHV